MIEFTTLPGPIQAIGTVGIVLAEALVLYIGYGALSRIAKQPILNALTGDR